MTHKARRRVEHAAPAEPQVTRREEILAVAADIFWQKGYHATSMNDVADATGLRKASLYHHVASKETMLYEMSTTSMLHMLESAAAATGDSPVERLADVIERHVEALLDDRSKHATALWELRSLPEHERSSIIDLRNRYDRFIDEAIADVQNSTSRWKDIPTRLVRLSLLGMLNWTVFWFDARGSESPVQIARAFSAIFLGDLETGSSTRAAPSERKHGRDGRPSPRCRPAEW